MTGREDGDGYGRYSGRGAPGMECIDAIAAALTPEEFRGFCKGCAIKYVWRERDKGGDEDLAKAADYLARLTTGSWLHRRGEGGEADAR